MAAIGHLARTDVASVDDLKEIYRRSTCAVERRRAQAMWLLLEGQRRKTVVEITAYSEESLRLLILSYNEHGLLALKDKRHDNPGAPTVFTDEELLLLARMLRRDFEQGKVWRAKDVLAYVEREFGKQVHLSRIYEVFDAVGISKQTTRPRHALANHDEQEAFKKNFQNVSSQLERIMTLLNSGPPTNTASA